MGNREPSGCGAYVIVNNNGEISSSQQDYLGSFGLYLYEEGDYFAISNSFLHLVEYLMPSHKLTLNKQYADHLLTADYKADGYENTLANEITLLDRNCEVRI